MTAFGFSERDARRIGRAVRVVERMDSCTDTSGPATPEVSRGVRVMIGTFGTAAWGKASSATLTIHAGPPGSTGRPTATAGTVVAYNIFADISTASSTARWAAISNNGFGWYVVAAECAT